MAKPIGKTFVEISVDSKKYEKGIVDVKTTTKKKLSEIEKAWKGLGKKSEATYDSMRANVNKNYDKIKKHSLSTADDIVRAEKAKNDKIARINKQQFGERKSLLDKAKKHWMAFSAAAIAAVYAIGRALQKSLSMFADWEVALNRLGNVSDETIPEMREKILSISPALGTVTELTKGYYGVLSAGVTEPLAAMDLLTTSAKLSKEATIEQDEAVKGLVSVMGSYSTELTTAKDAADLLYGIERAGITTVGELTPLIGNLANMATAAGLSADEMAAALAQITTTGAGTSISVTQLQSLLTALSKKFALLPPEVTKYGSATKAVKALGFQGVLKEIMEATGGNSTALIKMLGRQEAYLALLQLSKNEFGAYSGKLEDMTNKTGAFDDAWKRYSITLTAIWNTFKNTIGKKAILIGEKLAPAIKRIVENTSAWMEKNQELIDQGIEVVFLALAGALEMIAKPLGVIVIGFGKLYESGIKIHDLFEKIPEPLKKAFSIATLLAMSRHYDLTKELMTIYKELGEAARVNVVKLKIDKSVKDSIDKTTDAVKNVDKAIEAAGKESALWTKFFTEGMEESRAVAEEAASETSKEWTGAFDTMENDVEDYTKTFKDANAKQLVSLRNMYEDMESQGDDYWRIRERLIEIQLEAYKKMFKDIEGMENIYNAWSKAEYEKLQRDKTLASDDFVAGVELAFIDLAEANITWANAAYKIVKGFAENADAALSEFFFDAFTGELEDFEVYWEKFWSGTLKVISGVIADMVIKWAAGQVKMAAASKAAAGASAASWTSAGAAAGAASLGMVGVVAAAAYIMYRARTRPRGMNQAEMLQAAGLGDVGLMETYGLPTDLISRWEALETVKRSLEREARPYYGEYGEFTPPKDLQERINANKALISTWRNDYSAAVKRINELNETVVYSAQTVQDALTAALMISDPAIDKWESFTQHIKSSLYEAIVGGITEALMESALFQRALLPITIGIQDAFEAAFDGTTFNAQAFFNTVDPLIAGLSTTLETLKPAFEAVSAVTTQLGGMLLPGPGPDRSLPTYIPATLHKGGIVGQTSTRAVPTSAFANAPRAHRGLMAGEIPIIAKRGEGVFTPAQMQALGKQGRGSSQPIHIHLNLDGREVGLAIVKDGDVVQQMDYQLTKMNRRVYA